MSPRSGDRGRSPSPPMKPRTRQRTKKDAEPEVIVIEDSDGEEQDEAAMEKENHQPSPVEESPPPPPPALGRGKEERKTKNKKDCSNGDVFAFENGASCHQCRQKTIGPVAKCKNETCHINFCAKCLRNRYGEELAIVIISNAWICPRCRGICNCSLCMKKKGCTPTGAMAHCAKSAGCASVAEYLTSNPNQDSLQKRKQDEAKVGEDGNNAGKSKRKRVLADSSRSDADANIGHLENMKLPKDKSSEAADQKKKQQRSRKPKPILTEANPGGFGKEAAKLQHDLDGKNTKKKKSRKKRVADDSNLGSKLDSNGDIRHSESKSNKAAARELEKYDAVDADGEVELNIDLKIPAIDEVEVATLFQEEIVLPEGDKLDRVAGSALPTELIGPALQLLEFCSAFQKLLCLRDGQAEDAFREVLEGFISRRGPLVHLHMKLLEFISDEGTSSIPTRASWFESLKQYLSRKSPQEDDVLSFFDNGTDSYDKLEPKTKLQLLNRLCDDCLCKTTFRESIENSITAKVQEEAKNDVIAARKKLRSASQKRREAQTRRLFVLEARETELTTELYDLLAEKVRVRENQVVAAEMALAEAICKSKIQQCSDHATTRTEPIIRVGSRIFWKLKGVDNGSIIAVQEFSDDEQESWSRFSQADEELLVKFMASERLRACKQGSKSLC